MDNMDNVFSRIARRIAKNSALEAAPEDIFDAQDHLNILFQNWFVDSLVLCKAKIDVMPFWKYVALARACMSLPALEHGRTFLLAIVVNQPFLDETPLDVTARKCLEFVRTDPAHMAVVLRTSAEDMENFFQTKNLTAAAGRTAIVQGPKMWIGPHIVEPFQINLDDCLPLRQNFFEDILFKV